MRRLILIGLLAALTLPAAAAKRVTVAQLEQSLASDSAAHRQDDEIARQIGQLELSERLTDSTLERFAKELALGPRTALALQLLADQSAFLDPPTGELPATANPDAATKQRMMDLARGYVVRIWPHLPNFFVTRTTARFDDGPRIVQQGGWPVRAGMHLAGATTRNLTYRDGQEVVDPDTETAASSSSPAPAHAELEKGMTSRGEFGPELTIVLTDTAKGTVTWSHWEQTSTGLAAVYTYSVPRAASHFDVSYCCLREDSPSQRRALQYGNQNQGAPAAVAVAPPNAKLFHATPGYHGTLSIDPNSGAILRVTLEAELKTGDPISRAATVVQYGPVMIGDRSYIFPMRSLAFSMEEPAAFGHPREPPTLLVNQATFTGYHRLGASIRMIAEGSDAGAPGPASANPSSPDAGAQTPPVQTGPAQTADAQPPPPPVASPSALPTQPALDAAASLPTSTAAQPDPAPPSPPAPPVTPEITVTAANEVPDLPANTSQEQNLTFKVTSRLVDVGIVVYDKSGHPVNDLKPENFEVYDNGRKQEIRSFSQFAGAPQAVPASPPVAAAAAAPEQSFSNRPAEPAALQPPAPEASSTVLLIDESNIAWSDMNNARKQALKFLGSLAPGERVGLYSMTPLGFRVLEEITADHAAIIARLQKWMPRAQSVSQAQDEEMRNRQQFDEVHNVADLNSVNGNQIDVPDAQIPIDPLLRTMGSNPARASLIILAGIARHLSAVTGHKNLIWISSDNVFADWQSQQVGIDKSPKVVESYALHAQEAMNDAHVAVFPVDVSQLETSAINADIMHRNVELNQEAQDTAGVNGGALPRNVTPGRITAEMQQDIRPIQGPIRQVADATGGRVIRRAGDLAAEFNSVVEAGHATYLISFSPQGHADDRYHTISIKMTGKQHGLTPRYRTGYMFSTEPVTLKDRFKQAVWQPRDVNDVAITAGVTPMNPGINVKLNIAAGDLGLQQQAGRWMDKLDIFFIQRDDAGIHAQVEGQTLGLRLMSSTYQSLLSSGVPFERVVQMRAGMASLRVLVVDENSGRMGSVTVPAPALKAER